MSYQLAQKKPALEDWHRADIIAELRKAGWTLRSLSRHHGYQPGTLRIALQKPWPRGEQLIAEAISKEPAQIWPTRYRKARGRAPGRGLLEGSVARARGRR